MRIVSVGFGGLRLEKIQWIEKTGMWKIHRELGECLYNLNVNFEH